MKLAVVACEHWRPGVCAAGHHGGVASVANCHRCEHYAGPPKRFTGRTVDGELPAGDVPAAKPADPVPRGDWPTWATAIAALARDGERGVGTVFARLASTAGIGAAYKALWRSLGTSCGCGDRQRLWDEMYPL